MRGQWGDGAVVWGAGGTWGRSALAVRAESGACAGRCVCTRGAACAFVCVCLCVCLCVCACVCRACTRKYNKEGDTAYYYCKNETP